MQFFPKLRKFLLLTIVLCTPLALSAEQFEIKDSEGFEQPMVAHVVNVPSGWQSSGRIAWDKPCSGNDLYETLFVTRSPDGQSGARIMPGYQFFMDSAQPAPGAPPDPMINMMVAQSEASLQSMASQFRGSNCAVGELRGTQNIVNRLILPNRPAGTRILQSKVNQSEVNLMRQTFGGSLDGVNISFDSQIIDLGYTLNNTPTMERLYLSWFNFTQAPFDMGGVIVSNSHTVIDPLRFVWSPSANASQALRQLENVLGGIQTDQAWLKRVNEVREVIKKKNDSVRAQRDAESDKRHKDFIQSVQGSLMAREAQPGMISIPPKE